MLKPLHNGYHNISSLVICFKGVKSILVLCKPETEVFVGSLSVSSVSTSGGLSFLALESAHLQPNRTFARGCFPLTKSQIALCLEGQQQKKGSQRKHESLFTISTVQIKALPACCCPQSVENRWWMGKLLWLLGAIQTSLCLGGLEKLWVAEHCPQRVDLSALDLAKMIIRL